MPDPIVSPRNPLLKEVRRAVARGTLTSDGFAVAESFHLLEEAVRSGCEIRCILAAESVASRVEPRELVRVVPDTLFREIASTETSQGVISLVKVPSCTLSDLDTSLVVVLDGVQDPGNAGTIARSSEAFGATSLIFASGSVSPFNPKTLRASAGSLFRLSFACGVSQVDIAAWLASSKVGRYSAVPRAQLSVEEVDWVRPAAVIVGNEGRGVGPDFLAGSIAFAIPTGGVESLNAAVAASVVLYEAARQRRQRTHA